MADIDRDYLDVAWQRFRAAPLSLRKARVVAVLIDAYVDLVFEHSGAEDILLFRKDMARTSPALGLVMDYCAGRAELVLEAVSVPIADYGALDVADFMVSLYNNHSVQRLMLVRLDGTRRDVMEVFGEALEVLDLGLNNPTG